MLTVHPHVHARSNFVALQQPGKFGLRATHRIVIGSAYQWQAAVSPAEWASFLGVPPLDEALERCDQLIHRTEIAMAPHPPGDDREPQLDLVEP
jgi:hypothetical protein